MLVGLAYGSFFSDIKGKYDEMKQKVIDEFNKKFPNMEGKLEQLGNDVKNMANGGKAKLEELEQKFETMTEELKKTGTDEAHKLADKLKEAFEKLKNQGNPKVKRDFISEAAFIGLGHLGKRDVKNDAVDKM